MVITELWSFKKEKQEAKVVSAFMFPVLISQGSGWR